MSNFDWDLRRQLRGFSLSVFMGIVAFGSFFAVIGILDGMPLNELPMVLIPAALLGTLMWVLKNFFDITLDIVRGDS